MAVASVRVVHPPFSPPVAHRRRAHAISLIQSTERSAVRTLPLEEIVMGSGSRRLLMAGSALAVMALFGQSALAQGTVTGKITAAGAGQPLGGAHVLVLSGSATAIAG